MASRKCGITALNCLRLKFAQRREGAKIAKKTRRNGKRRCEIGSTSYSSFFGVLTMGADESADCQEP